MAVFSSTAKTAAWSGGFDVQADHVGDRVATLSRRGVMNLQHTSQLLGTPVRTAVEQSLSPQGLEDARLLRLIDGALPTESPQDRKASPGLAASRVVREALRGAAQSPPSAHQSRRGPAPD